MSAETAEPNSDDTDVPSRPGSGGGVWEIMAPADQTVPMVLASPHSGRAYTPQFIASSRLDAVTLRRTEDAFVDELFAAAPGHGIPLLRALFPRAYVDPNREAWELDPAMFEDPLPAYVNTASPRAAGGLGTVPRVVASGQRIYAGRIAFADAKERVETLYEPYHEALRGLVEATRRRFGACLLLDCHSMPAVGGPMDSDAGNRRLDVVLGDRHGTSCAAAVTAAAERTLLAAGFAVARNDPYAGGFTTAHYGRPASGVHALQIELNRALYMDETAVRKGAGMAGLCRHMEELLEALAALDPALLVPS